MPDGPEADAEWDRIKAVVARRREALKRTIAETVVDEHNEIVDEEKRLGRPRLPLDADGPEADELLARVYREICERVEIAERFLFLTDPSERDPISWLLEPFVALDPASPMYANVLVHELRAYGKYGFSWKAGESMPREHGGQGRTIYRVVVAELADALDPGSLDRPAEDDQALRERIAHALPAVFADRSDSGSRGPIADAVKNERKARMRRRRR